MSASKQDQSHKAFEPLSPLEAIHDTVSGLYEAGIVDSMTMRKFNKLCVTPVRELSPGEIKVVRLNNKVSQSVFAKLLNVSVSTVKQWESGEKHPHGASLKLLNVVAHTGIDLLY